MRNKPAWKPPRDPKPKKARPMTEKERQEAIQSLKFMTRAIGVVAAVISFIPMLIISVVFFAHLSKKYLTPTARRINDISLLLPAMSKCLIWNLLWMCIIVGLFAFNVNIILIYIMIMFTAWFNVIMAKWTTIVYFGCIVDPYNNKLYFRQDQSNYGILDYLTFKFFRDLDKIDSVNLSTIGKISRQHWDKLYIAGEFGSRNIRFSNKQKRDECIHAIQSSVHSVNIMFEMEH